jgi:hypothetical protein
MQFDPSDDFDLTGVLPFDTDGVHADTPQKPPDDTAPAVLGDAFAYVGQGLTADQFRGYVQTYNFGTVPPDYIVLHHTAIPSTLAARYPTGAVWDANEGGLSPDQIYAKRKRQLDKLRDYYRDTLFWTAGPHLFIDEKYIWLFTPMYNVGIHAAQGNSYRDKQKRLHYSIGIEVIGYYEHTVWPTMVARNVSMCVAILRRRLKTFQLIDGAWAGKVGSHRLYNKPSCPGAAIQPSYYLPLFRAAEGML